MRTEILQNNYITLREIKDAALRAVRLRKEKSIKTNSPVSEINDQENNIDAVNYNSRGNFQNNYTDKQQNFPGRGGYPPARGGYKGPQNTSNNSNSVALTNQSRGAYRSEQRCI